jgi:H+-transporting ATPase
VSIPNAWIIGAVAVGHFRMGLDAAALDTLALVALVFGSQTTLHAFRERRRLWSRPGLWLNLSFLANVLIFSTMAVVGILMTPLPLALVTGTLVATVGFGVVLAAVKMPVFKRRAIA